MPTRIGRALALVSVLLWTIVLAGSAAAQPRVEENVNLIVTGEITAIDAAARKVTVKSTNDDGVVYEVEPSATIMSEADKIALGDLKAGWHVAMNGHRVGDAKRISLIKVVKRP
jgi:hypothetical protein